MSEFAEWDSFYVIVGSAAGALIGLQFVVLTLIAERPPLRAADAGAAFATPTIVHFGTALLLSESRTRRRRQPHAMRSEEHTSELQSLTNLVCRLLPSKKNEKEVITQ